MSVQTPLNNFVGNKSQTGKSCVVIPFEKRYITEYPNLIQCTVKLESATVMNGAPKIVFGVPINGCGDHHLYLFDILVGRLFAESYGYLILGFPCDRKSCGETSCHHPHSSHPLIPPLRTDILRRNHRQTPGDL